MSNRTVIRSDEDNHVLFSLFKAYYPENKTDLFLYQNHRHAELEISCILNGSGIYNCCGDDYIFSPGDVFLHCGNDTHYFKRIDPPGRPALLVIRFDSRFLWSPGGEWSSSQYLKLFSNGSTIRRCIPHDAPQAKDICKLLEEMFEECRVHAPVYDLLVKARLMMVLAYMVRHFSAELTLSQTTVVSQRHLAQMESSMRFILSHLGDPMTLDRLSKEACMSRSYYTTMFKSLNGLSVWEYIIAKRIDLAQHKLETTQESILNISQDCGFTGIANFNRAFKKITGKTPREYRKLISLINTVTYSDVE